jgi:hypothetical protein
LSDPPCHSAGMKTHLNGIGETGSGESLWQTLAGCAVFGAALLALCCML